MLNVLVVTGDAGEAYEALYAVHRLREAGCQAIVAAPSARRLNLVIHDFEPGWDTYIERQGYGLAADVAINDVDPTAFDAVLLLGGRAPEYLRNNTRLVQLVQEFNRSGKWIFAICHGVQILVTAGLLAGKKVTCYEHVRAETELAGATWVAEQVVRDGRIVTAQTWQSHPDFYREVLSCLGQQVTAAP